MLQMRVMEESQRDSDAERFMSISVLTMSVTSSSTARRNHIVTP